MLGVGLGLAVLASVALNVSFLLQHAGSHAVPALSARRPLLAARSLLGSPLWLAGGAAGIVGSLLHLAALSQAPLFLVQAFSAGGLVVTVPAAARWLRQHLDRSDLLAVTALAVGLAVLGVGAAGSGTVAVPAARVTLALAAVVGGAGAVLLRSRGALGSGAAGGLLYGAVDSAVKAVALTASAGTGLVLASPWPYVAAVLALGGFACFQRGLQIGPAVPFISFPTPSTTVATTLVGLLAFREPLGTTVLVCGLHLVALCVAAGAGLRLLRTQSRLTPA